MLSHIWNRSAQLYADVLVHYLERSYVKGCELAIQRSSTEEASGTDNNSSNTVRQPELLPGTLLLESAVCDHKAPLSLFDAENNATYKSMPISTTPATNGWRMYEDRPDKPGYIAENTQHAVLTFHLQCNVQVSADNHLIFPVVTLTYLKSYEGVGIVQMYGRQLQHPEDVTEGILLDAMDTTEAISPYVNSYMQLDDSYNSYDSTHSSGVSLGADGGLVLGVTVSFRALHANDTAVIAARMTQHDTASTWNAQNELRQGWKFKIVRLSCC
jgi:hypothetical protein